MGSFALAIVALFDRNHIHDQIAKSVTVKLLHWQQRWRRTRRCKSWTAHVSLCTIFMKAIGKVSVFHFIEQRVYFKWIATMSFK
jgi:hypothetical protein